MNPNVAVPWQKIYDFTLTCGQVHELKAFSTEILFGLRDLCDFDQSLVYFLDGNGKIYNQYLLNIDKQWSNLYLEYYAKTAKGYYEPLKDLRENPAKPTINVRTWKKEMPTEFVSNYIRSRGLNYSLGFVLFDLNGKPRTLFALDKTKDTNFTDTELMTLSLVVPQLNNLHKYFFCQPSRQQAVDQLFWETSDLTPREQEIVNLLCQGISPAVISQLLYISQSTTNKHIAHIYKKMHVSNIQELLVRMLAKD